MSKEHLTNLDGLSQAELIQLYEEAKASGDYSQQLLLCYALLPYEDRPGLALTEIKELKNILAPNNQESHNT